MFYQRPIIACFGSLEHRDITVTHFISWLLIVADSGSFGLIMAHCSSLWLIVAHGGLYRVFMTCCGSLWLTVAHCGFW